MHGKDRLAQSSNYAWAALTVQFFGALVVAFGLFTLVCVLYVNLKRWIRSEKKGRLCQFLTVAENYASIMLFFACLDLYFSYYPFARNFHHFMNATGPIQNFEPLWYNVIPLVEIMPGQLVLPIENPFGPYAFYAITGLVIVVLAATPFRRRSKA